METFFPNLYDLNYLYGMVEEYCNYNFPQVIYKRFDGVTQIDDIHNETPDSAKIFKPDIPLRAYVTNEGEKHPLSRWGIEKVRRLTIFVSVPHLIKAGVVEVRDDKEIDEYMRAGDRIVYSKNVVYDILEWRRGDSYGNTDIPIFFQGFAEIYRPDSNLYAEP